MTAPSSEPSEPVVLTPAQKRRRFWARLIALVVGGLFVLPTVLQTEPQLQRADAVQLAQAGGGGAGGHGRRSARHATQGRTAPRVAQPFNGAVRERPLSGLETLSTLAARDAALPRPANLEAENRQIEDFTTPVAEALSSGPLPITDPGINPVGLPGGVAPPVIGNPTTTPVLPPPVVVPPVVTPPVTPPVVTPPVVDPTNPPPVVTPPDNPPVTPPVVIITPPTVDPGPPDPGGPGPIDPGGPVGPGNPIHAVPEPATWVQLILGAAMVGTAMRRRRPRVVLARISR